jgi:hypothetical protein
MTLEIENFMAIAHSVGPRSSSSTRARGGGLNDVVREGFPALTAFGAL